MAENFNMDENLNVSDSLELDNAISSAQNEINFEMPPVTTQEPTQEPPPPKSVRSLDPSIQPGSPGRPGQKAASDFQYAMSQAALDISNDMFVKNAPKPDELVLEGPNTRYANKEVDLYKYQEDFNPIGFDPFNQNNYEHWAGKETWSSALWKGLDSFGTRFGDTFIDSFASYGRMTSALVNWDWRKMMPSEKDMMDQNWAEHIESMKNFVFVPPEQEDDIISKRSVSEFIGNAGFALGTFGALSTELAIDAAITYFSGGLGAGSFGATLTKFAGKEAIKEGAKAGVKESIKRGALRFGDFLSDVGKGAFYYGNQSADALAASAKVANKVNQAGRLSNATKIGSDAFRNSMKDVFDIYTLNLRNIVKSKSFSQLAGNIAKGLPVIGTGIKYGEKIAVGAKAGLSTGKLVGIGLLGARRVAAEINMASTESGFEAVSTYGQTLDLMIENYKKEHGGENPTPEALSDMQAVAMKSATRNYQTNMGILLLTNRLQFGGLFNKYVGATKLTKELLEEGVENTLRVNRVWKSSNLLGKVYEKGFMGTLGLFGKISTDFGKKQAFYEVGKMFAKNTLKFEITEGLQENIQEMSADAWKNYYASQYNGVKQTLGEAFENGYDAQFTKQGFRTFLQGALTGALIKPAVHLTTTGINKLQEHASSRQYKDNKQNDPYVQVKTRLRNDISLVNTLLSQMSNKKFEDRLVNFTTQVDASLRRTEGAAKSSKYEYHNAKDNQFLNAVLAANRSGSSLVLEQAIREMGASMTDAEFESAFNIKLSDTKYNSAKEFAEDLRNDARKYTKTIDGIRSKLKSIPDPLLYEKDSKERLIATMMNIGREEAVRIVALNAMKATRASERAIETSQNLLNIPGLANSAEYSTRVLANPENFRGELGNIYAEIKVLQESLSSVDASTKPMVLEKIKNKKELVNLLNEWISFWENSENLTEIEGGFTKETNAAKVTDLDKKYDTFVGVPFTVQEYNDKKELVNDKKRVYSLDHERVVQVYRDIINLRNKEANISDEISEESLRDALDNLIDYMRLSKDAKEYTKSMDILFNPDYYKQTVERITDGRFKYELLEYVDTLQQRVRDVITYTIQTSNITDKFERVALYSKLNDLISTAIKENDAYKNLVLLTTNTELGLDHAKFAEDNVKILDELLHEKFAEILDSYSQKTTEDLTTEEFEQFEKTGFVSGINLNIIARKVFEKQERGKYQQLVYENEEYKKQIDNIANRLKEITKVTTTQAMQELTLAYVAKEKIVNAKIATEEELTELTSEQIIDFALERGLITPEDVRKHNKVFEPITDEEYQEFVRSGYLSEDLIQAIAEKDFNKEPLSNYEREILDSGVLKNQILKIQDALEEGLKKSNDDDDTGEDMLNNQAPSQPVPEPGETTTNTAPQTPAQSANTNAAVAIPQDSTEPAADTDEIVAALTGIQNKNKEGISEIQNLETLEEKPTENNQKFNVDGNDQNGYTIKAENGTVVNQKPIQNVEDAQNKADNLNSGFDNNEWVTSYVLNYTRGVVNGKNEGDMEKIIDISTAINSSLDNYNKTNKKDIKSFKEYFAIKEGTSNIIAIVKAVIENRSITEVKKELKKQRKESVGITGVQTDLFDTTATQSNTGPAIVTDDMQLLMNEIRQTVAINEQRNNEIMTELAKVLDDAAFLSIRPLTPEEKVKEQQIIKDINAKYSNLENAEKIGKFVSEDTISEESILKKLQDIASCFK